MEALRNGKSFIRESNKQTSVNQIENRKEEMDERETIIEETNQPFTGVLNEDEDEFLEKSDRLQSTELKNQQWNLANAPTDPIGSNIDHSNAAVPVGPYKAKIGSDLPDQLMV